MATIWLYRHGQAGDIMGEYDLLSPLGWQQSERAGTYAQQMGRLPSVDRVVVGAMRRHDETRRGFVKGMVAAGASAESLASYDSPRVDARLNEYDHKAIIRDGLTAGLPQDRSFFGAAMRRWAAGEGTGESYAAFESRVVEGFESLRAELGAGQTTVVFSSGGVISAICRHIWGLTPARAFQINRVLANTSVTSVLVSGGEVSIGRMNDLAHVDGQPQLWPRHR